MPRKVRMLNGYRLLYKPDYKSSMENANWNGYVYEHIFIMEKYLKRELRSDEVVHHLDCNRSNNRIENLLLLERGQHAKLHTWIEKGAYICESDVKNGMNSGKSKEVKPTYCEICEITLQEKQKFTCSKECNLARRKLKDDKSRGVEKPTREQLEEDMKTLSWLAIGRKYNVSNNGAKKWAKKYGLL